MCGQTLGDRTLCVKNVFLRSSVFVLTIMICCKRKSGEECMFFLSISKLSLKVFIIIWLLDFNNILEISKHKQLIKVSGRLAC